MTAAGLLLKHTWCVSVSPVGGLLPLALLKRHATPPARRRAPGFLLAGGACYVLKDAADRNRLGASTFVRLNWGVAAVEAGYSVMFGGAIVSGLAAADAASFSNLGGSLVLAAFCGFQAVAAKAK